MSKLALLIPAVVAAILVGVAVGWLLPFGNALTALLAGAAIGIGVFVGAQRLAPRVALSAVGAKPVAAGSQPRLENLVEGLCHTNGFAKPKLHLVDSPALDAAAIGRKDAPHLVVTSGLLGSLDRLELEAVLARQLATLTKDPSRATNLALVALVFRPFSSALWRLSFDPLREAHLDVSGVKLTRYPPALATALETAGETKAVVNSAPATQNLWIIGPMRHLRDVEQGLQMRIDTLREL